MKGIGKGGKVRIYNDDAPAELPEGNAGQPTGFRFCSRSNLRFSTQLAGE
jgi:hypothetical protein